nr:hypothetical protein [Streptomyces sp. 846.5]
MSIRQKTARLLAAAALAVAGLAADPLAGAAQAGPAPVDFYVSPIGSDTDAGTAATVPFRTLAKAQPAVRGVDQSASGAVTVNLAGATTDSPSR